MSKKRKGSNVKKPVRPIEEFIEINKYSCLRNAQANAGDPDNAEEVEELLKKNGFYMLLCGESPETNSKVRNAYRKYVASVTKKKGSRTEDELCALFASNAKKFPLPDEQLESLYSDTCEAVEKFYSDINNCISKELAHKIYYEPASLDLMTKFKNAVLTIPGLNADRLTYIVRRSDLPHRDLESFIQSEIWERTQFLLGLTKKEAKILRHRISVDPTSLPQTKAVYSKVIASFDRQRLVKLITASASYRSVVAHLENRLLIDNKAAELILKEIPDSAADLYPGARQIDRHFILHLGPTNSGKTYSALEACKAAGSGVYLGPLRLLAYEVCEKFNLDGIPCNMLTGEERITVEFASHTSSTVEMFDPRQYYDVAVVDECQLIEDEERGGAWTAAILGLMADKIHLCAAPEAKEVLISLIELCGDTYETVEHERFVPLLPDKRPFTFPESVEPKDALIVFSKASVLYHARKLAEAGIRASVIYGALPYDVRRSEVNRFVRGETQVVVATDAIGMGLNLPIKRVVFLETFKFDGYRRRFLNRSEVKQIAGRAGRRGLYDTGYFTAAEFFDDVLLRMKKPGKKVTTARLRFPETILTVDMPLSEILLRWNSIANKEYFRKNIVIREVQLSRDLEQYTDDKFMIYRFVTIPFNEISEPLYNFWFMLFESELHGRNDTADDYSMLIESDADDLDTLELAYRKCDILYAYFNKFDKLGELEDIMRLKRRISESIMRILGEGYVPETGGE